MKTLGAEIHDELEHLDLNEEAVEKIYVRDGKLNFHVNSLKEVGGFHFEQEPQIGCTVYTEDYLIFLVGEVREGMFKWWFESLPRNPEVYEETDLNLYPLGC